MKLLSKNIITILVFLLIVIAMIAYLFWFDYVSQQDEIVKPKNEQIARGKCLEENEVAEYEIRKEKTVGGDGIAIITVKDKKSQKEQFNFRIDILQTDHYHPIELHKCYVYAAKSFNYDYTTRRPLPDYRAEIWRYNYKGNGEKVVLLDKDTLGSLKRYEHFFSSDFRVSPSEKYIVLERGYLNKDDYALVIKDLKTKEDIFTLPSKYLQKTNSNFIGVFDMLKWSEDSRYFWGSVSDGAYVNGYFRIDTQNWKVDIFEAPDGAMGGMPLNINTGYVPIQPGQVWTGDYQLTQELKEQYRKEGKKSSLYLYNLFTKEQILLETTNEPLWFFKPRWLSNTELEYELPSGEKKIYKIEK